MRILIVDDSAYIRSILKTILEENGNEVVGLAKDGESAIDLAMELVPDLITLDNILPDMTGIDVLKALNANKVTSKVIMISAVGQQSAVDEGLKNGALDYIVKPFNNEQLVGIISNLKSA